MDLNIIMQLIGTVNPIVLGGAATGLLAIAGGALYVQRNKSKFIENTDPLNQSNDFKTLRTEDLEREFGSLTVQTKMLDEDESLFFQDEQKPKSSSLNSDVAHPSTRFVDEASVFDGFGKHEQALEALKKAVEIEKHDKEKVRLKILVSQYSNKKGKVSLDEIIKEYPSFHVKSTFDPENTISSLMSSKLPKSDSNLNKINDKQKDKEFDIFADIPILNEEQIIENFHLNKTSVKNEPKVEPKSNNIFDDLPSLETVEVKKEVTVPTPKMETKPNNIFDDLPSLETVEVKKDVTIPTPKMETKPNNIFDDLPPLETVEVKKEVATPVNKVTSDDQFAWSSSSSNPFDDTEKVLQSLKQNADIIDKANEEEAMDDMQKFLKEFGGILGDIKSQEKQQLSDTSKSASLPILEEKVEPVEQLQPVQVVAQPLEQLKPVEPPKPVIYKVWANWIVDINGKQTFRNHFVTLKNPWGTAAAGEELYMGLSKVSKGPDGKTYPWVLVSVFPLQK